MFLGKYTAQLSDGGRLSIPKKMRREVQNGEVILFTGFEQCIYGFNKKRINSFKIKIYSSKIAVKGKTIGIVDDIIGTGGTLLKFHKFAKKSGAKKVIALVTHGVLDTGIQKIKKRFKKLYLANTINRKEANVDITNLIADVLK